MNKINLEITIKDLENIEAMLGRFVSDKLATESDSSWVQYNKNVINILNNMFNYSGIMDKLNASIKVAYLKESNK